MAHQQHQDDGRQPQPQPQQQQQLNVPSRPRVMLARTHSAPLVTTTTSKEHGAGQLLSSQTRPPTPLIAAVENRLASNGSLQSANDSDIVNIAVLGSAGVGKSTFVQHSLGLDTRPTGAINARRISLGSETYLVRMLECQLDDVVVDGTNRISWPLDRRMPRVDAACTLYDISNKDTFEEVPVVLSKQAPAALSLAPTDRAELKMRSRRRRSPRSLSRTKSTLSRRRDRSTLTTANNEQKQSFATWKPFRPRPRMPIPMQEE